MFKIGFILVLIVAFLSNIEIYKVFVEGQTQLMDKSLTPYIIEHVFNNLAYLASLYFFWKEGHEWEKSKF